MQRTCEQNTGMQPVGYLQSVIRYDLVAIGEIFM